MHVLVVNAGSSSVKLRLLDDDNVIDELDLEATGGRPAAGTLESALKRFSKVDAVGHRIVHGGPRLTEATRVDEALVSELEQVAGLAPLHVPPALEAMALVKDALPYCPAVACFDTAFHASLAPEAYTYAVPEEWRRRYGVRRYGFHGLSHAYVARRAAEMAGHGSKGLRIVSCHLGAGASVAAIRDGRSVDTTMGFTPLEGLVMATRSGTVDPGMLLWLIEQTTMDAEEVREGLERGSGLLGLAGTADMRQILSRDDDAAQLSLGVYVHRLRASIAQMAAAIGGLDVLAFTGGIGQASAPVRARVADGLGFLGVELDAAANEGVGPTSDGLIGSGLVSVAVLAAREDLEIARQVRGALT